MIRLLRTALILTLLAPVRAELVVVTASDSPIQRLSRAQLTEVFSGRTRIVNGVAIVPIEYAQAERERFYQQLLGRTSSQMRATWARLMFTGEGQPPREYDSASEALARLQASPELITYIDSSQLEPGLRVIFR